MKWMCVILSFSVNGVERTEKPLQSFLECQAWKHQQEFHYAVAPVYALLYTCEPYWEA